MPTTPNISKLSKPQQKKFIRDGIARLSQSLQTDC